MSEIAQIGEYLPAGSEVEEGQKAWRRIKKSARMMLEDWAVVGQALAVGRGECLSNKAFGKWCDDNGFGDIDPRLRSDAMWLVRENGVFVNHEDGLEYNNPSDARNAYRKRQKQLEAPEPKDPKEPARLPEAKGLGLKYAHRAIAELNKIPHNDALRTSAFRVVTDWIEANV